jgi:superfamily II DNA or RNA helicase
MDIDKAYLRDNLYLPKMYINGPALIRGLTYEVGDEALCLARETDTHIIVPRNFIPRAELEDYAFDVIDESQREYTKIDFKSSIKWRSDKQELAHSYLSKAHSGIFNLNPGRGKTVHALKRIEELGHPALIVVTTTSLAEQWIARIKDPNINLTFPGKIGFIGDGKFDWRHGICIAMIQSLANKVKNGEITEEFKNWFGSAYFDEGHHLGARVFSTTADVCYGRRICLTATPDRVDGLECILKYHMGDIIYSDLTWEQTPKIEFNRIYAEIKTNKKMPVPTIMTKIAEDVESNEEKLRRLKVDVARGRKIIAVSNRLEQLNWFHSQLPGSVLITADTDKKDREKLMRGAQVSLVIAKLGVEAIDVDILDCLHLLNIMGADKTSRAGKTVYLGNNFLQLVGRIMRIVQNKPEPEVVIHDNIEVEVAHSLAIQLRRFLNQNGFEYTDTE